MNKKEQEYLKLCEEFLKRKEEVEQFDKVEKKEFYNKIGKAFKDDNNNNLELSDGKKKNFTVTRVIKTKMNYDIPKLKDKLSKDAYSKFLVKDIKVNDPDGLIAFFKKAKIDFADVSDFLNIDYKVDEKKLEEQLQLGVVTSKQVSEWATAETSDPYFLVKRIEDEK